MIDVRTKLTEGGRIVIPAEYRQALGLQIGDELILHLEDGEVRILEEIQDREWDRVLSSPEGIADAEQERAKTMEAIATGGIIEYIPGKSLKNYFKGMTILDVNTR